MYNTKLRLSADELSLIRNSEWILTKNRIIEKVSLQFSVLSERMQAEIPAGKALPSRLKDLKGPKISRGEKYRGLPYVMLDFPRIFEHEHIFAIRTFFWWGNFYSMTLHVKGVFKTAVFHNLCTSTSLNKRQYYLCTAGDEWNHDLNSSDYRLLAGIDVSKLEWIAQDFVKVSVKVDFSQADEAADILAECFTDLLQLAGC